MSTAEWVVVLEAQPTNGDGAVDLSRLRRLLEHMPGVAPVALHSAERLAVQMHVNASGQVEALGLALADFRAGLPMVGLGNLRVLRAEVLSWDEYERDCRLAHREAGAAAGVQEVLMAPTPAAPVSTCCARRSRTR